METRLDNFRQFELPPETRKLTHLGIAPDDFSPLEREELSFIEGQTQSIRRELGLVAERRNQIFLRKVIEIGVATPLLEQLTSKLGKPFKEDKDFEYYKSARSRDKEYAYFCPHCTLEETSGYWIKGVPIERANYITDSGLSVITHECIIGNHFVGQIHF